MRGRADQVCDGAARPAHHASRDPPPPDQYVWEFTDEDQGASFSAFGFMWQVIKVKAAGTGLQNSLQTKKLISHREAVFHSRFARIALPKGKANMANDTPKIGCRAKKSQKIKKSLPKQVDKPGLLC